MVRETSLCDSEGGRGIQLTTLAAIDVGSNAMRLAIGRVLDNGRVDVIETARSPVRLGQDVFLQGRLSSTIIDRAAEAFHAFNDSISRNQVDQTAAVATSAVREAVNRRDLTERIRGEAGIDIDVIGSTEEARLVHLAVSRKLDIDKGEALLVDIGGGSVELILTSDGLLIDSMSCDLGTVRMLQVLSGRHGHFAQRVDEVMGEARDWIAAVLGHELVGTFVGTGGNVEAIGDLTGRRVGKRAMSFAYTSDMERLRVVLEALDLEGRRGELNLKSNRADVIYPATLVLQALMSVVWATTLLIPRVGLREGLLADMAMRQAPIPVRP